MAALETSRTRSQEKRPDSKRKVVIAENAEALKTAARDAADTRLTASKGELRGVKGFAKRIWKHNLFHEVYRQKEIVKAKAEIIGSKNIYAADKTVTDADAHHRAMQAITDRFSKEYEEAIHPEAGEERRELSRENPEKVSHAEIKKLIADYASGTIDEANFIEIRNGIVAAATGLSPEAVKSEVSHSDNLLEIAKQIKQSVDHGERLEDIDLDFDVVIGKAKSGVRTEAQYNAVDRMVDKVQSWKVGKFVNEATLASAVAIAYSLTAGLSQRWARSKLAAWGTFGLSALVGAGVAGARESKRLEDERRQHFREMAQGKTFDAANAPRRKEMDEYRYQTESAAEMAESITSVKQDLSNPENFEAALGKLADIEARVKLSDRHSVDLIAYSSVDVVDQERLQLDAARAELKVALRHSVESGAIPLQPGETIESLLEARTNTAIAVHTDGDKGIRDKDRRFNQMKRWEVGKAILKGFATGLVVGGVAQEVLAAMPWSAQHGVAEGLLHGAKAPTDGTGVTALEGLRLYFAGELATVPAELAAAAAPGGGAVLLPAGVVLAAPTPPTPGMANLIHQDGSVTRNVSFRNGTLTPDSRDLLHKEGVSVSERVQNVVGYASVEKSPAAYIQDHKGDFHHIRRTLWYDNDTPAPVFDKNELKLHWGGARGTGIGQDGQYTFNVGKMAPDGSYHGKLSVNAQEAMKHGHLKMLLSLSGDTQANVVEVPIDPQGNAKVDPNSEIGKIFFKTEHGKAVFVGKFAEVGEMVGTGKGPDGQPVERFRILATHGGAGRSSVLDVAKDGTTSRPEVTPGPADQVIPAEKYGGGKGGGVPDIAPVPKQVPITALHEAPAHAGDYFIAPPPIISIFPRSPLEPLAPKNKEMPGKPPEMAIFPGYYYGSGSVETVLEGFERKKIDLDSYTVEQTDDKRVFLDKHGEPVKRSIERERERIKRYLEEQQDKNYLQEIESINASLPPMDPNCRVAIIIPARFEEKNLANLLDQYSAQTDGENKPIDPRMFEINIIINRKQSEISDNSMAVIESWKTAHPGVRVNAIELAFEDAKAGVGLARKYITDLSLLRSVSRNSQTGPLYIESEDADLISVDKRTVWKLTNDFDQQPHLDVLRGIQDRQPEIMMKNDLLFFTQRLRDFMEVFLRRQAYRPENDPQASFVWNRVISGGWNTAYTAEAYAQIGGYETVTIGEDTDIGQKISVLRGTADPEGRFTPNTQTAKASGLRSNSSPRRFIDAMARGIAPYDDFENQSLKNASLDELLQRVEGFANVSEGQFEKYRQEVANIGYFIRSVSGTNEDMWRDVVTRTLRYGGLKAGSDYEFKDGNIELKQEGMETIVEALDKYKQQERWRLGYRRQNTPLGQGASEPAQREGNENEVERQMRDINEYFVRLGQDNPSYEASLHTDLAKLPAMDEECRTIAVLRGGNQPQNVLDSMLQRYAAQLSADPRSVEFNVMISKARPAAMAAFESWKQAYPEIRANAIDINARKYVDDLVSLHYIQRDSTPPTSRKYPLSIEWPAR